MLPWKVYYFSISRFGLDDDFSKHEVGSKVRFQINEEKVQLLLILFYLWDEDISVRDQLYSYIL